MTPQPIAALALALSIAAVPIPAPAQAPSGWQAGTARAAITPRGALWMAGYAARTKPSEGKVHELWAKALALKDPRGKTAVLVTLDLCGIGAELSGAVRDAVEARHGLGRDRVVLACSHTHSGPVVGTNLITMYKLDEAQRKEVDAYAKALTEAIITLVGQAIEGLEPAELAWSNGHADFAVNRRENPEKDVPARREAIALKGPVDHDVPVLRVADAGGRLRAVVFAYACHCTVLDGYQLSGDYAGFAQDDLEAAHPGSQAMFVAGCGADQNPIPRRSLELAVSYGKQLASSVEAVLAGGMTAVEGPLGTAYEEIPLRFEKLPTRADLEETTKSSNFFEASRARSLLARMDVRGKLDPTYPYPVQSWSFGGLTWVFLGGEVVVDYALRIKQSLGSSKTWVAAYCNDVMAYIPSARVLKEGGYEGGGAMLYYAQPSPWAEGVEEEIVSAVARSVRASRTTP